MVSGWVHSTVSTQSGTGNALTCRACPKRCHCTRLTDEVARLELLFKTCSSFSYRLCHHRSANFRAAGGWSQSLPTGRINSWSSAFAKFIDTAAKHMHGQRCHCVWRLASVSCNLHRHTVAPSAFLDASGCSQRFERSFAPLLLIVRHCCSQQAWLLQRRRCC